MQSIYADDSCFITRDILINDQVAFRKGEQVVVEKIEPNPQSPQHQYVVLSVEFQKRFQLSEYDLAKLIPDFAPLPEQVPESPELVSQEVGARESSTRVPWWVVLAVVLITVCVVSGLLYWFVTKGPDKPENNNLPATTIPTTQSPGATPIQNSGLNAVGIYKSTGILHDTLEFKADGTWVNNLYHSINFDWNPDDPTSPPYIDRVFSGTYKVEAKDGEYPVDDVMHKTIADVVIDNDKDPSKPIRWHLTDDGNLIRLIDLYVKQ